MQIENHKEEVPFAHYEELFRAADPAQITARLGDIYRDGEFHITLLGTAYAIAHPDYAIHIEKSPPCLKGGGCESSRGDTVPPLPTQTFLLRYLLEGSRTPWNGQWLTFREMPWGELYIKPYTGRVLTRAAWTFGPRLDAFRKASEALGADSVPHGDAGYRFQLLPGLYMQILAWEPDEEFPPNAQVLYSDNFQSMAAEDRVVAGDILISTIKAHM